MTMNYSEIKRKSFGQQKFGKLLLLPILLAVCVITLSACSSDNDDSADQANTNTDDAGDPAAVLARAAINNGYYLSRVEEFDFDGSSLGGYSYSLNSAESRIERRDLDNDTEVDGYFRYNDQGDLTSISFLSTFEALAPLGDEIHRVDVERSNGRLDAIDVEYMIGNEEDTRTVYMYGDDGRISDITKNYLDSIGTEQQTLTYENGVLVSIVGNDIELPGVTITETVERDAQGRVSVIRPAFNPAQPGFEVENIVFLYDANGNISEEQLQDGQGNVVFREVYTYEATSESVFNLQNYNVYFVR